MNGSRSSPAAGQPWKLDVCTGERALTTTGGKTWDAARKLCRFLESAWEELPVQAPLRILELGSGTGWLGMTIARNIVDTEADGKTQASVLLTEQPGGGAMEWLQHNVDHNRSAGVPLGAVRTSAFDWAELDPSGPNGGALPRRWAEEANKLNMLIGSDLVYDNNCLNMLPKVFKAFATASPRLLLFYAHTLHRFDSIDIDFCKALGEHGLTYRAVAGEGCCRNSDASVLDPLAGEGFLEELFPEHRVAIFQILLDTGADVAPFWPWSDVLSEDTDAVTPSATSCARVADEFIEEKGCVRVGCICVVLPGFDEPQDLGEEELTVHLHRLGPFGSGQHPTTALMLRGLQERTSGRLDGLAVCDYGCGSGILALVAHRLGASRCTGVDLIPEALDAARINVEANTAWSTSISSAIGLHLPRASELDRDLEFYSRYGDWRSPGVQERGWQPLPEEEAAGFDIVAANIVVGSLCRAANSVKWLVKPDGELLLAGIRQGMQAEQVHEAYGHDFELTQTASLDGWVLLRGKRRLGGSTNSQ